MKAPLAEETAELIYDVLVQTCGASDRGRAGFVFHQTSSHVPEYRFMGSLGFGGKFWRTQGWLPDNTWGECWYVNCYPEDRNAEREAIIAEANAQLWIVRQAEAAEDAP